MLALIGSYEAPLTCLDLIVILGKVCRDLLKAIVDEHA